MGLLDQLIAYMAQAKDEAKANPKGAAKQYGAGLLSGALGGPLDTAKMAFEGTPTGLAMKYGQGLLGIKEANPEKIKVGTTDWFQEKVSGLLGEKGNEAAAALGQLMAPSPSGKAKPMRSDWTAYHGSPHKFDKFSLDKIGTGEGAQAYGHGLYFADTPEVAKSYANALAPIQGRGFSTWDRAKVEIDGKRVAITTDPQMRAWRSLQAAGEGVPDAFDAAKRIRGNDPQALRWLEKWEKQNARAIEDGGSSIYKVDIDDARAPKDAFLDWDKPLKDQPKALEAFRHVREQAGMGNTYWQPGKLATGVNEFRKLESVVGREQASALLKDAGIPGIRYLDAGSRGSGGTYNTVLFDDSLVKILERK